MFNSLSPGLGKRAALKSPRHGEWVDFKSGDRTIKAFVVYPERKDKAPVVLVIHEIFGLTDWVRGVCDQLAENGVIAIAPDLLSGQTFEDVDGARKAISALPKEQVNADLNAASDYALSKIPAAIGALGVCGFCLGRRMDVLIRERESEIESRLFILRNPVDNPQDAARIACPVYGFYAEKDARVNAAIPKAEELMKAAGKNMSR